MWGSTTSSSDDQQLSRSGSDGVRLERSHRRVLVLGIPSGAVPFSCRTLRDLLFTMTLNPSSASLVVRVARQAASSTVWFRLPATALPPRSAVVADARSWPATGRPLTPAAAYHCWSTAATAVSTRSAATGAEAAAGGPRRPAAGVRATPTAAQWFSASAVGGSGGDAGVSAGVPSTTQINAALDDVNERFAEARLLLGEARDALGSVYFGESWRSSWGWVGLHL